MATQTTIRKTILYISDQETFNTPLIGKLRLAGYDVVNTSSPTQAVALLFLMYSAAGIVLSHHAIEHASFDLVHSLRTICPHIPIILLREGAEEPTASVDICLGAEEPLGELVDTVQRLLSSSQPTDGRCKSEVRAA